MSVVEMVWAAAAGMLAYGAVGPKSMHWAARVLCGVGIIAGLVGAVVGAFLSAEWSAKGGALVAVIVGAMIGGASAIIGQGAAALERFGLSKGRAVAGSAVVLVVAVLVAVMLGGSAGEKGLAAADSGAAVVVAAQAQAVAEPAAPGCDCAAGAVCTGPRGGKYCLTAEGKKRYLDR